MDRRSRWQERLGEEVTCVRCGETRDSSDVDRMLWCVDCVAEARERSGRIGTGIGVALALAVAAWIWLSVQPSDLIPGAWLAVVIATGYLGRRMAREIVFGVLRSRE